MITITAVKLHFARVYVPDLTGPDGRPRDKPSHFVTAHESENPGRPDILWRAPYRPDGNINIAYRSSYAPRITIRDAAEYVQLIKLHDLFRVRNIPLDVMLRGAVCDIILSEYNKGDETILQLSELIFDNLSTFNINGDRL